MTSIVLVTYRLDRGGTDRVAWEIACGMAQAGLEVTLLCCTSAGALHGHFTATLPANVRLVALSGRAWGSRTWGQIRVFLAWRRWLKRNRPQIVLATGNNICWFSGLGTVGLGKQSPRLVIKTTNPVVRQKDSALVTAFRRRVYGWLFGRADHVLTLSEAESTLLRRQFPAAAGKFRAVFNPYLTRAFEQRETIRQGSGQGGTAMRIIAAGRLAGQKNFPRLLRAFATAKAANPGVALSLSIAGEGKDRQALLALAEELGVAEALHLPGHVTNLPDLLEQADLFALSSDYEGLPAVVIEALACDCPVIATDCFPNARELLSALPDCRVTERSDEAFAHGLSAQVRAFAQAGGVRPALRAHAMNYTTRSSVRSHIAAMGLLPSHPEYHVDAALL